MPECPRIRMLEDKSWGGGRLLRGRQYSLPPKQCQELIELGVAVPAEQRETTSIAPTEQAVHKPGQPRKRSAKGARTQQQRKANR